MKISLVLNGKNVEALISDDRLLIDFLRDHGCLSVKSFPVLSWQPGPTATGSTPWRGSRRRPRSSARSSPTRERNSAVSVIRAWS